MNNYHSIKFFINFVQSLFSKKFSLEIICYVENSFSINENQESLKEHEMMTITNEFNYYFMVDFSFHYE